MTAQITMLTTARATADSARMAHLADSTRSPVTDNQALGLGNKDAERT